MTASLIFSGRRSARSEAGLPVDGTEGGLPLAAVAVGDAGLSAVADFWTAVTSGLTGSPMSRFYAASNLTKVWRHATAFAGLPQMSAVSGQRSAVSGQRTNN